MGINYIGLDDQGLRYTILSNVAVEGFDEFLLKGHILTVFMHVRTPLNISLF